MFKFSTSTERVDDGLDYSAVLTHMMDQRVNPIGEGDVHLDQLFYEADKVRKVVAAVTKYPKSKTLIQALSTLSPYEGLTITSYSAMGVLNNISNTIASNNVKIKVLLGRNIANERTVRARFQRLHDTLKDIELERAYVTGPNYNDIEKRLVGIITTCTYLNDLAKELETRKDEINLSLYEKVVGMMRGVFQPIKDKAQFKGITLYYQPYEVSEFDITASPWKDSTKQERIMESLIKCKYDCVDLLKNTIDTLKRQTDRLSRRVSGMEKQMELGNEESNTEYSEVLDVFHASRTFHIICKAVYKEGIEKEVNRFISSGISSLCKVYSK